ncbi:MAG: group 1 glycosyl transferase [Alkalinema sp. CACIAM 70d]|nr:MAG: group 1 glycosyl transferase [Alkalinema sp. CACIAM 70d]
MRVIIVAEHASAKFGGEAFLPLHYFRLLRQRNLDVWLVVHERTRAELEQLFPDAHDRMHFVPDTWVHLLLFRLSRFLPRRIGEATTGLLMHLQTQSLQRRVVRQLVRQYDIDIVHEPISVSPKLPSLMYNVGAPVVMGPLNGGMNYPPAFRDRQSRVVDAFLTVGRWASNLANRLIPGRLRAKVVLVANDRTRKALPQGIQGKVIELVENGVDLTIWPSREKPSIPQASDPSVPRFVYVGRLIDWKGLDLLLAAFRPVADATGAILEIIGDGAIRENLEAQAHAFGLRDQVIFHGWLSQPACAERLQQADVFVLPSLLECGGAVVLEAMAIGLPVIATAWGGPMDYVTPECGILVEPDSPADFVQGLTEAMLQLAQSSELRSRMGQAARQRVEQQFDWERKVDRMIEIYQQTIALPQTSPRLVAAMSPNRA